MSHDAELVTTNPLNASPRDHVAKKKKKRLINDRSPQRGKNDNVRMKCQNERKKCRFANYMPV